MEPNSVVKTTVVVGAWTGWDTLPPNCSGPVVEDEWRHDYLLRLETGEIFQLKKPPLKNGRTKRVITSRAGSIYRGLLSAARAEGAKGTVLIHTADGCREERPVPHFANCRPARLGGHQAGPSTRVVWPSLRMTEAEAWQRSSPFLGADDGHSAIPWEARKPQAVWRGDWNGLDRPHSNRAALVANYSGNPLFDVGFVRAGSDTNINRSCRAMSHLLPINWSALGGSVDQQIANCKAALRALEPKGSLTTAEQAGYKMVLVLEGNGAASSMSWVLASGSTALIPTPTSAEVWVGALARPGVHYLPLKQDLSDAADKAAWCVRNGAECGAIAAAAHALMRGAYFGRGPGAAPTAVDYAARMAEIERRVLRRVLRQVKAEPACDVGSRVGLDAKSGEWLADHNVTHLYTRYRPEAPPRGKFRLPAP